MKKSGFITLMACMFPGGGQMYLGYIKRGLSLMLWFAGLFFLAVTLNIGALSIFMVSLWFFALFDAFTIRNLAPQQRAAFPDDYIPPERWVQENLLPGKMRANTGKILGWVFVLLGVGMLYSNMVSPLLYLWAQSFPALRTVLYNLPTLVLAAAALGGGIWLLLRGNKPAAQQTPPDPDRAPFYVAPPTPAPEAPPVPFTPPMQPGQPYPPAGAAPYAQQPRAAIPMPPAAPAAPAPQAAPAQPAPPAPPEADAAPAQTPELL